MATFTDRVQVVVDFVTDGAKRGLSSLKADVAAADTTMGKAKAAASNLGQQIGPYMGAAAMAGGAAVVGFATKSVKAFADTSLAAGKFADATAVSVDEASRWIAVGEDFGISAETIQGALMKVNKASDGVFAQYGVEVAYAADGTRDANQTFINALDTIGKMPDANERARAATALFGKSYGEVSRLIEMGADDITAALGNVSEAQVIDNEELAKAREFQAAMDELNDALKDIMLSVGEGIVPALSDLATTITSVKKAVDDLPSGVTSTTSSLLSLANPVDQIASGLNRAADSSNGFGERLFGLAETIPYVGDLLGGAADKWNWFGESVEFSSDAMRAAAERLDITTEATEDVDEATLDAARAIGEMLKATAEVVTETEAAAAAYKGAGDEIQRLSDLLAENREQAQNQADANRAAEAAGRDFADAMENLGGTMLDTEASASDVEDATWAAADSAISWAESIADAGGAADGSQEKQDDFRTALQGIADTLAPGSPLRVQLDQYIADLTGVPAAVNTSINLDVNLPPGFYVNSEGTLVLPGGMELKDAMAGGAGLSAMDAWYQSILGNDNAAGGSGGGGAPQPPRDPDAFGGVTSEQAAFVKRNVEKASRRYERGDITAEDYLWVLRQAQRKFRPLSDFGMWLWREIKRVRAEMRANARPDEGENDPGFERPEQPSKPGTGPDKPGSLTSWSDGKPNTSHRGAVVINVHQHGVLVSDGRAMRRALDAAAADISAALRRWERSQG